MESIRVYNDIYPFLESDKFRGAHRDKVVLISGKHCSHLPRHIFAQLIVPQALVERLGKLLLINFL